MTDMIDKMLYGVIVIAIVFLVTYLFGTIITVFIGENTQDKISIMALNDGSELNSVFLSGSDEEFKYYFYKKTSNGIILDSLSVNSAKIFEDSSRPHLLIKYKKWNMFTALKTYEFHIPKGSIVRKTILDLEFN